jgi:hypothetical protein
MFTGSGKVDQPTTTVPAYVEDVFSTSLYTGTGNIQTISNGLALGEFPVVYQTSITATAFNSNIETQQGDFIIVFIFDPISPTCTINGSSVTANSTRVVDSNTVCLFIQQATTSFTRIITSSVALGSITILRGPTSMAIARSLTDTVNDTLNLSSYTTTGFGLLLLMDSEIITPTINVDNGSFAIYNGTTANSVAIFGINGNGNGTQPRTVSGLSTNARTGYAIVTFAGAGTVVGDSGPATNGGMVWIKNRSLNSDYAIYDTVRAATFQLSSNLTAAQSTQTAGLLSFNTNSLSIGSLGTINASTSNFVAWSFGKKEKFFDVVTYTGNGSVQNIPHNLGSTPGCIMIKRLNGIASWYVYHRSLGNNNVITLPGSAGAFTANTWNYTNPTETQFTVSGTGDAGLNGATYVAYIFAHNAGGFGDGGQDNIITCGVYTGNGSSNGPQINLNYEPQWVLIKNADATGNWVTQNNMTSGFNAAGSDTRYLFANTINNESVSSNTALIPNGFALTTSDQNYNSANRNYIYIAIRRGPMKKPELGINVLGIIARNGTGTNVTVSAGLLTDLAIIKNTGSAYLPAWFSRPTSNFYLASSSVSAQTAGGVAVIQPQPFDVMTGIRVGYSSNITNISGNTFINYLFKRFPATFDLVCDTGTGTAHSIPHNLTVVPELMIRKKRNSATNSDWLVWHSLFSGTDKFLYLNLPNAEATDSNFWTLTPPTASVFNVGTGLTANNANQTFITWLFATLTNVSKIGNYTGTAALQTINCGFTTGARFVMIKRIDSTGDWYVWDSASGISSGNDPYFLLNSTAAQVTTTNYVDADATGFKITATAPAAINANGGTFIYLAIA